MGKTRKTMALLVISAVILWLAIGCEKESIVYIADPLLFRVSGQISDSITYEPIDSAAILMEFTRNSIYDSIGFFSDSRGEFSFTIEGGFHDNFDVQMSFAKTGYIAQETTLVVTHQNILFDSLNIYLSSE